MFIQTDEGLTFGRNLSINKNHIAYNFVLKALNYGREDLAEKLVLKSISNIFDITISNEKTFLYQEKLISQLVQKILIKYIYYFELENINYRFILCNIIKNLQEADEKCLLTILENHMPITKDGRVIFIEELSKNLIALYPKDIFNFSSSYKEILEYDFDESKLISILYNNEKEFGLKGAL